MAEMRVLVIEPEKKPYVKTISSGLTALQMEVGGYIQAVYPWDDPCAIICDDEAKLNGKKLNRALRDDNGHIYDVVAGTFLIAGLNDDDFASLSEDYIRKYNEMFAVPELFVCLSGKIMVVPMEAEED